MLKEINNRKNYLLLAVAIVFLPIFNLIRVHQSLSEEDIANRAIPKEPVTLSLPTLEKSKPVTVSKDNNDLNKPIFMPQETKEIREWMESRGYIGPDDEQVYGNYNDTTLIALAKNNDLRAVMFLADKAIITPDGSTAEQREQNIAKATAYWTLGAALGSTTALDYIALYMNRGLDDPRARPVVLNIMAIYKTIEMRGDVDLSKSSQKHFVHERSIVLTPEEQNFVNTQADEIYQDLQNKRRALGLGDFDNTMTDSVKRFFGVAH